MNISQRKKIIKKSTWLLACYLILAPLDFFPVISGVSVSKLLIFMPLIACLFHLREFKIRIDRYLFFLILYMLVIMGTIFYSLDSSLTSQRTITICLNIVVVIVLSMLSYKKNELLLLKKAMVLSGWFTLLLMVFYSNSSIMGGRITVVVNGVYQDPNYLTGFLIFSIVYYFGEFVENKKLSSIVKMSIFLIFILLTGSRGGLLAVLGSLLFFILFWIKTKKFKISSIILIILITFSVGILFNFASSMLPESIMQRYSLAFTLNDNGAGREVIWKQIIYNYNNSLEFNKIFGWGAGTIRYFDIEGEVAHNIWLESLMEIGIIGVLVFLAFYITFLVKAINIKEYVVASSLVGYIIMGMTMSLYSYKPIWNILLLIMILKNTDKELKSIKLVNKRVLKERFVLQSSFIKEQ